MGLHLPFHSSPLSWSTGCWHWFPRKAKQCASFLLSITSYRIPICMLFASYSQRMLCFFFPLHIRIVIFFIILHKMGHEHIWQLFRVFTVFILLNCIILDNYKAHLVFTFSTCSTIVTFFHLYHSTGIVTGSWFRACSVSIVWVFQPGPQTVPMATSVGTGLDAPSSSYFPTKYKEMAYDFIPIFFYCLFSAIFLTLLLPFNDQQFF